MNYQWSRFLKFAKEANKEVKNTYQHCINCGVWMHRFTRDDGNSQYYCQCWDRFEVSSNYLKKLRESGEVEKYPSLNDLIGLEQDPEWHPEGDVWEHTLLTIEAMKEILLREEIGEDREILLIAALCHDMGKPVTTILKEGRWTSPSHANKTENVILFLDQIEVFGIKQEKVIKLVESHDCHIDKPSKKSVRKLLNRLEGKVTIKQLLLLVEADVSGRYPLPKGLPENGYLIKKIAEELAIQDKKPKPIIEGKHLISLGVKPGPKMGLILTQLFKDQTEGLFSTWEEGIEKAKKLIEL